MKALTYALALIVLVGVTPAMALVFTWTGAGEDGWWTNADNWERTGCLGGTCYPQTTDDDAQILVADDEWLEVTLPADEEIDSLTIRGYQVWLSGFSKTLTVNSIVIAGGASAETTLFANGVTIETD